MSKVMQSFTIGENEITLPVVSGKGEGSVKILGSYGDQINEACAPGATALGGGVTANSDASHAEGLLTTAGRATKEACSNQKPEALDAVYYAAVTINDNGGDISMEDGSELIVRLGGFGAHAEGMNTQALGSGAHSEGSNNIAFANSSHAEGDSTYASGQASHAEGYNAKAYGNQSHAEGADTEASSYEAHAEGKGTKASGKHSHSEGYYTEAKGIASHAEGYETIAEYDYSHASGLGTKTINNAQTVVGQYNKTSKTVTNSSELFTVGSGTSSNRANAFNVYKNNNQSYGLISHGMYVNSVNSNNLLQTAASVYNKIDSKLEPVYDKINTKLDNYKKIKVQKDSFINPFKKTIIHIDSSFINDEISGIITLNEMDIDPYSFYGMLLQPGDNEINLIDMYDYEYGEYPPNPCSISWNLYSDYAKEIVVTVYQIDDQIITTNDIVLYPEREKVYIDMSQLANGPIFLPEAAIVGGIFIEGEIEGEMSLEPIDLYEDWMGTTPIQTSIIITNNNKTESIINVPWFDDARYYFTSSNYGNSIPGLTGSGEQLSEIKYYYYKSLNDKYTKSIPVILEIEWEDDSLENSKFTLMGLE